MSANNNRLKTLLSRKSDLTQQEIAEVNSDILDILEDIHWFHSVLLEEETKRAFIVSFIDSLGSAKFRLPDPKDFKISTNEPITDITQLFAEYVFVQLWAKRDILTESEANLLYTLLVPALSKSKLLNEAFRYDQREEMIADFIAYKIITPVAKGRDTTHAWDNVTRSWHLVGWLNRYLKSYLKNHKDDEATLSIEDDKIRFAVERDWADQNLRDSLTDTEVAASWKEGNGWSPDLLKGCKFFGDRAELEEINSTLAMYDLKPDTVYRECVSFLKNNDSWVQYLLANVAAPNTLALSRFGASFKIKSIHYQAAKLGIISRKSYPAGSDDIQDYHQNTLLGQWMAHTFGLATPLRPALIHTLFKLLCTVALKYDP